MEDHFEGGREVEMRRRMRQAPDPLAMLRTVAARAPTRSAILHLRTASDAEPEGYNYAEAAEAAARLAAALAAAGVGPDDTVAIIAPSVPETLVAIAAASSVAVAFPLNLLLSAEAMASQLARAKARAVIAFGSNSAVRIDRTVAEAIRLAGGVEFVIEIDGGHAPSEALAASAPRCVSWSAFLAGADPRAARAVTGGRAAALFHTGGTTGAPKLAELSLDGMTASLHASALGLALREDDRVLQLLPFFHVGGALAIGLSLFSTGATLMNCSLAGARDPDVVASIWLIAAKMRASVVGLVPPTWSQVAAQGAPERWPELRGLVTGATAMLPELARRLSKLSGVPMSQLLGMTELSGCGAGQPLDGSEREPAVGYPAPLVETKLEPIAPGGPAQLLVRGPMLFRGYRTREGLTGAPVEDWFATGDLGEILPDGQLRLIGRAKDVIIRSGHNIDPVAIEEVATRHPEIVIAAAVGIPDAFAGELPVVYAVRKPGASLSEEALAAFIAERIDEPPARPKRIIFVDSLPLTGVGKVARYRLRQSAAATRVAELLSEIPGVGEVSCDDMGARHVTVAWTVEPDDETRRSAEAVAAPLGIAIIHTQSRV